MNLTWPVFEFIFPLFMNNNDLNSQWHHIKVESLTASILGVGVNELLQILQVCNATMILCVPYKSMG